MFYSIAEMYILKTKNINIWEYLNIRHDYWCKIKKNNKITLEQYKKLSESCDYHICDNQEELAKRMIEIYKGW